MVARAKPESRLVYTRLVHGGNTEKNQTLSRNSVFCHQNHPRASFKDDIVANTWTIFLMLLIYQKTKMPLTLPNNNEKTKTTMSEIPSQLDIKSWTSRVSMYFYYAYQMKKMKNPSLSINCVFFLSIKANWLFCCVHLI